MTVDVNPEAYVESTGENDPEVRLRTICELDRQIAAVPKCAASVVRALKSGKENRNVSASKQAFTEAIEEYNQLIQSVNHGLRDEVARLYAASKSELIPLSVHVQASAAGREKGEQLLRALKASQDGNNGEMSVDADPEADMEGVSLA